MLEFALIGNPNCGKTTLFNSLTDSTAHTGNLAGVTVEVLSGRYIQNPDIIITDLPGIYSLSPYSNEEILTLKHLVNYSPDIIINIIDSIRLERSLYLTSQLMETGIPIVIALNMADEAEKSGIKINAKTLSHLLKLPVVQISALNGKGCEKLINTAIEQIENTALPNSLLMGESIFNKIADIHKTLPKGTPFITAVKMLEENNDRDWISDIAEARYKRIVEIVEKCMIGKPKKSVDLDIVLTNRYLAIPSFILIIYGIFRLTFGTFGCFCRGGMEYIIGLILKSLQKFFVLIQLKEWAIDLIINGIGNGIGTVLSFLPQLLILFTAISILEESGYMARVAFIMDRILRRFGISGRAFVPMIMGFGCTVPAIMSTRVIKSERERKLTIFMTPFMCCGARMTVFTVIAATFFTNTKTASIFVSSLCIIGVLVALASGFVMQKFIKTDNDSFIMEMPPYRLPSAENICCGVWQKTKDFVKKAFTTLLTASVIIWFLQSFTISFTPTADNVKSILATIGQTIAPFFAPCGFGDWRTASALITGLVAKETVLSTLAILYNSDLTKAFSTLSAYSFCVFTLLYTPCIAAFSAIQKELNSLKQALIIALWQFNIAYLVSMMIYFVGRLII